MKKNINPLLTTILLISIFLSTFLYFILPEYRAAYLVPTFLFLLILLIKIIYNLNYLKIFFSKKSGKKLINNLMSFFLLFCILCLVNFLALKKGNVWDVGKNKFSSLTEQTEKVISNLNGNYKFKIFSNKEHKDAIYSLLNLYQLESSKIEIEYIDPEIRSDLVSKFELTLIPSIVIEKDNGKNVVINQIRELELTNGFLMLERQKNPTICLNENAKLEDSGELGFTFFVSTLKNSAFEVHKVDLLKEGEISIACDAFYIINQTADMTIEEIKKIKSYYEKGGNLFVMQSTLFNGDKITNFRVFLSTLGMNLFNNVVIDRGSSLNGSNGTAPLVSSFDQKNINTNLNGQVLFPIAGMVSPSIQDEKMKYVSLATSTKDSWAENSLIEVLTQKLNFDEKDISGPVDLAGALLKESKPRLMVIANASMVSNKFVQFQTNFKFILNLSYWITSNENLSTVQANVFPEEPIFISDVQKKVIFYNSIILIPIFMFIMAIVFRKRLKEV